MCVCTSTFNIRVGMKFEVLLGCYIVVILLLYRCNIVVISLLYRCNIVVISL